MIITFFGHRSLVETRGLRTGPLQVVNDFRKGAAVTFYCGGYGEFDALCASVCREICVSEPHCRVFLVAPYLSEPWQKKYNVLVSQGAYDGVIYPPLEGIPPRFAVDRRNRWMAEQADLVITYVQTPFGGACRAAEFARRLGKPVVNLATGR